MKKEYFVQKGSNTGFACWDVCYMVQDQEEGSFDGPFYATFYWEEKHARSLCDYLNGKISIKEVDEYVYKSVLEE